MGSLDSQSLPARFRATLGPLLLPSVLCLAAFTPARAAEYDLKATPSTVAWGYYWSEAKPALRIKSGDTVTVQTLLTASPVWLSLEGVDDEEIPPELGRIFREVPPDAKGPGPHLLTGPIYVEGSEPGDVLEVRIQKIQLGMPFATNGFSPDAGVLPPTDFPYGFVKIIKLD